MSCRRRRGYRRFSTSAYRLLGDFEVAINGGVWVATGVSELEELGGCIAAEAYNTKSRPLRKSLDAVFEKIEQLNLKYCDEDSSIQETSIPQLKKKPNLVLVKK